MVGLRAGQYVPGLRSHDLHRHGRRGQLNFFFSLLHDDRCSHPLYPSFFLPSSFPALFLSLSPSVFLPLPRSRFSHSSWLFRRFVSFFLPSIRLIPTLFLPRSLLNAREEDRTPRIPRLPVYAFACVCAQFASHRGEIEWRLAIRENQ